MINVLKSKLQEVYVTSAREDYDLGSITIDEELMDKAEIHPWEQVHVNGAKNRIITYAIPGPRGSGCIELNGNAAPCFEIGEKIHVLAYQSITKARAPRYLPIIVRTTNKEKCFTSLPNTSSIA